MNKEISLVPTNDEMTIYKDICKYALESAYFSKLGGLPGIMCIALYAREIGVPAMTALMGGFSNVQGKITMSAELMNSLIRREGHKLEVIESTAVACKIKGTRHDTGETYTASFTLEEAKNAGLIKGGGSWEKYTSDMLFARCISRLRRRLFPDIATRSYVEGEIEEDKHVKEKLVDTKDEAFEAVQTAVEVNSEEPLSEEQAKEIAELVGDDEVLAENILKGYKKNRLEEIPAKHFEAIRHAIQKRRTRNEIA